MKNVLELSMDMLDALIDIERTGIKISKDKLAKIKKEYEDEYNSLYNDLMSLTEKVMGDTPINLDSADDRSILFYSRKVTNKAEWKQTFNIGTEQRGHTKKQKRKPNMSNSAFNAAVKSLAPVVRKTIGNPCSECYGKGSYFYRLKSGALSKNKRGCKTCSGKGVVYRNINEAAGLRIIPRGPHDTAAAGFKTDKNTLEAIKLELKGDAREFVDKYTRYSKIST